MHAWACEASLCMHRPKYMHVYVGLCVCVHTMYRSMVVCVLCFYVCACDGLCLHVISCVGLLTCGYRYVALCICYYV